MVIAGYRSAAAFTDRMPVLLDEKDWGAWLGEEPAEVARARQLCVPYSGELEIWTVSRDISNIKNRGSYLAHPAESTPEPLKKKVPRKLMAPVQNELL